VGPAERGLRARRLSLCAWVPYPLDSAPGQRFRIEQWKPYLESDGISIDLRPFADPELLRVLHQPGHLPAKVLGMLTAFAGRAVDAVRIGRYDAVLVHRAASLAGPAFVERLAARMRPLIFDFDDAVYLLHTSGANRWTSPLKFPGKTATLCRISRQVVAGNEYLAQYARRFNPHVTVIPSSVDTDAYRPAPRPSSDRQLVLGWMGSSTSQTYLEMFAPVLRQILDAQPLELLIVSDREPVLPGVRYRWRPWSGDREAADLAEFDIGIMPMPDDEWARGKCSMKALQYMGMGVPAVCTAVGTNVEVIQHGENGFLATTPEDWKAAIGALARDPALRRSMGDAGRRTVEARYSMRAAAARFGDVVRAAVAR
jgi:glycosyltransferase involved in cell wall biosynthesis